MEDYFIKEEFRCRIANKPVENKKTFYHSKCCRRFAGVCRHLLDTNYK